MIGVGASVVVAGELVALMPMLASVSGASGVAVAAAAESVIIPPVIWSAPRGVRIAMMTSAASVIAAGLLMVLRATVL